MFGGMGVVSDVKSSSLTREHSGDDRVGTCSHQRLLVRVGSGGLNGIEDG